MQHYAGTNFARHTTLFCGLAALAAVWLGPLPAMSRAAFSPSMITHLGVVALAAPLLGIGFANAAARTGYRTSSALWPLAASVLELVAVWGWHMPAAHEAAARSWSFFVAEQLSYLATGLAIWFFAFAGNDRRTAGGGALACFMSFMHMTLLGMVFLWAPSVLYDADICRGAFGLSPLEDQQFGGMLMIGWGSLVYFIGGMARAWHLLGRAAFEGD